MESGLDGNVRGWNQCDPGPQGHWKFTPHLDEKSGVEDGYYLISPMEWEDEWYIYVESGISGNLSAWTGDPGPQGWFKLEPCTSTLPLDGPNTRNLAPMSYTAMLPKAPSLSQPQLLSEIRLEVAHSVGVDLGALDERAIIFHVDQLSAFSQKVGRQHQQCFFERLVRPNLFATLSRSIFELTLAPPATTPTLLKMSQNTVCINERHLRSQESSIIQNGDRISIGSQSTASGDASSTPFITFTVSLRGGRPQPLETCANVSSQREAVTMMDGEPKPIRGRGFGEFFSPGWFTSSNSDSDQRATSFVLRCVFSSSIPLTHELASAVIPLIPDASVTIGRMYQLGFFEKLLPDQESLSCISRSHVAARLQGHGQALEIENLSQNVVKVNDDILGKQQKAKVAIGSSLKFMVHGKTLLEFKFGPENSH